MNEFPHHYKVSAQGKTDNALTISADNLEPLEISPPAQFDGPGDQWSPEDLLMASVSSCLILSFRAIAKASKFNWQSIECEATGELDKVERKIKFTHITNKVKLTIPLESSMENAEKLLEKAEKSCLISNSLSCESHFECEVVVAN